MNAVMNNFSPALDVQNGPMLVAHRGGSKEWPENSLTAFRNVVREPIDMLEIDVHQTRDGRSVVMHDPTLDRTTTGMGPIRSFSAAEIGRFFLTGSVREPIPTLSDVLELLSGTRLQLRIDVKSDPAGASYEGLEEELLDQVSRYGMFDRTTVISFDRQVLDNMRKLSGKIPLGKNIGLKDIMRAGGMSQVLSELKDRGDRRAVLALQAPGRGNRCKRKGSRAGSRRMDGERLR